MPVTPSARKAIDQAWYSRTLPGRVLRHLIIKNKPVKYEDLQLKAGIDIKHSTAKSLDSFLAPLGYKIKIENITKGQALKGSLWSLEKLSKAKKNKTVTKKA